MIKTKARLEDYYQLLGRVQNAIERKIQTYHNFEQNQYDRNRIKAALAEIRNLRDINENIGDMRHSVGCILGHEAPVEFTPWRTGNLGVFLATSKREK